MWMSFLFCFLSSLLLSFLSPSLCLISFLSLFFSFPSLLLSFLPFFFLMISLWIIWNKFSQNVVSFIENGSYVARGWLFAEMLSLTQDIGMIRFWNTKIIGSLVCKMIFSFYSHRVYKLLKLVIATNLEHWWIPKCTEVRVQTEVEPITMERLFF